MTDFFIKNNSNDEALAKKAHPNGDIDLVISPVDGTLVIVAQVHGVHVCARCVPADGPVTDDMLFINDPSHKQRPMEWSPPDGQGTRLMLHAGCIGRAKTQSGSLFHDLVRGHQTKRFLSQAMNGIESIFRR